MPKRILALVSEPVDGEALKRAVGVDRAEAAEVLVVAPALNTRTRFLMSEESGAHADYKSRLIAARETVLTELFGIGWPAPHRVVPNAATERWLRRNPRGPRWLRALHRVTAIGASHVPIAVQPCAWSVYRGCSTRARITPAFCSNLSSAYRFASAFDAGSTPSILPHASSP